MNGTAGFQYFNELIKKMETVRQTFSRTQKLQLSALKTKAVKHDILGDWSPMIERAFVIWGV